MKKAGKRTRRPTPQAGAPAAEPDPLGQPGLLIGWSSDEDSARQPMGFSHRSAASAEPAGARSPILYEGEGHLLTIAPTGAGKGVGCIVPALLRHRGPIIVIDPKGENYAITARRRREMGQTVHVLDPLGVTDAPDSERATLNPLDAIDAEDATAVDDMAAITAAFSSSYTAPNDRFWTGRAAQLLLGILAHVVTDLPAPQRNLAELRRLTALSQFNPRQIVDRLMRSRHPLAAESAAILNLGANQTLGAIQIFAQEMIDFIRGPLVERATSTSTFSLESVRRGDPMSIYIVMPPHMLNSHGLLLRLWISALLSAITRRRRRPERSTLFLLDEAAQLGELRQLQEAVTLLRGYGLQTWSFWQDASQLRTLYPRDWRTIVNNCRVVQLFGAPNMAAAGEAAAFVGHVTAETILDLPPASLMLQTAGSRPTFARRPNYLEDATFAGQFADNPFYLPDDGRPAAATEKIASYLVGPTPRAFSWEYPPVQPQLCPNAEAAELVARLLAPKRRRRRRAPAQGAAGRRAGGRRQ